MHDVLDSSAALDLAPHLVQECAKSVFVVAPGFGFVAAHYPNLT
jgi:hypothetical protein